MKLNEFIQEFKAIRDKYTKVEGKEIRYTNGEYTFCPITLLYYHKTNNFMQISNGIGAGVRLGLMYSTAHDIVNAADKFVNHDVSIREHLE